MQFNKPHAKCDNGCMYHCTEGFTIQPKCLIMDNFMKLNGKYNWIGQLDRLIYVGKKGNWHQFVKVESPNDVWCEILDSSLHMIEESLDTL